MLSGDLALAVAKKKIAAIMESTEVPKVFIEGDYLTAWGDKTDERLARLSFRSSTLNFTAFIKMKPQGTSSLAYPKKNFTISLYTGDDYATKKKVAVRGAWGAQSKYVLKADWIDPTHACNVVSARIAAAMQAKYDLFPDAPNRGLVDGLPVLLHLNGECAGLYNWNIPKDGWMFGFSGADEDTALILCAEVHDNSGAFRALANFTEWSVEYGAEDEAALTAFNRMVDFVKDSTDEEFRANFAQYLNLDAALNYYCFAYLSTALDNLGKNMLMVTADRLIWYPCLYDMDSLWGVSFDGVGTLDPTYQCPEN